MKKLNKFSLTYLYFQLVRQNGSPSSVAMGVAIGFFTGFLIPMGGQMVIAISLAFILKARKIPALACTWVTNPWTVPFIYPVQCVVGSYILGAPLTFDSSKQVFMNVIEEPSWEAFLQIGQEFLIPFFIGGLTFGLVSGFIGYFTAYGMIEQHRMRRKQRLNKKLAAVAHRDQD